MITIIFEAHGTTYDNESHLASGHYDVDLSPLGEEQAKEIRERHKKDLPDAVFCSDLRRSYRTAETAFEGKEVPIIKDARLRECDYGALTRHSSELVDIEKPKRIEEPFPGGESYEQTTLRMKEFLKDLARDYDGKRVMIIGHRATHYALDHLIKKIPLKEAITAPWKWEPGWVYELKNID